MVVTTHWSKDIRACIDMRNGALLYLSDGKFDPAKLTWANEHPVHELDGNTWSIGSI